MTPEQFCYWLQGFGELNGVPPTAEQWQSINEHLSLVFKKVTPPVQKGGPEKAFERKIRQSSPFDIGRATSNPMPGASPPYAGTC